MSISVLWACAWGGGLISYFAWRFHRLAFVSFAQNSGSCACNTRWIAACRLQSSSELRGQGSVLATHHGLPHASCSLQSGCADRVLCLQHTMDRCMLDEVFEKVARTRSCPYDARWIAARWLQSSKNLRGQGPVLATDDGLLYAGCCHDCTLSAVFERVARTGFRPCNAPRSAAR